MAQTQDNITTNQLIDAGQLPESQRENIPQEQTNTAPTPLNTGNGEVTTGSTMPNPKGELYTPGSLEAGPASGTPGALGALEAEGTTGVTTTAEGTADINTPTGPVGDAIQNQANIIKGQQDTLQGDLDKVKAEEEVAKKEAEAGATKYQSDFERITAENNAKVDALNKEQEDRAKAILDRQNEKLRKESERSVADLEAEKTKAKLRDEKAIEDSKIANDIAAQRAAWSFNKLGLGFSSGAILQSQNYATQGAQAIANLTVRVSENQQKFARDISALKENYAELINTNVDKYLDVISANKKEAIERYNATSLDKLKTAEETRKEKADIATNFRKSIRDAEEKFKTDQRFLADEAVKSAERIKKQQDEYKEEQLKTLDLQFTTGEIARMTNEEKRAVEAELKLPTGYLDTKTREGTSAGIRAQFDKFVGEDFYIKNIGLLIDEAQDEMSMGKDLAQAIDIVVKREMASNPDVKKKMEEKKAKDDLELYKAETDRMNVVSNIEARNVDNAVKKGEFEDTYGISLETSSISSKGANLLSTEDGTDLTGTGREQCGEYVNDITGGSIGRMGDSMESKLDVANIDKVSEGDGVGRVAVWNAGNAKNGHTGVILSEDANGYWIKSSNINNDGKVTTDYVAKNKIQGFTQPVLSQSTEDVDLLNTPTEELTSSLPAGKKPLQAWAERNGLSVDILASDNSEITRNKIVNAINSYKADNTQIDLGEEGKLSFNELKEKARGLGVESIDKFTSFEELKGAVDEVAEKKAIKSLKEQPTTEGIETVYSDELSGIQKLSKSGREEFKKSIAGKSRKEQVEATKQMKNSNRANLRSIYRQLKDVVGLDDEQIHTYVGEILRKGDYGIFSSYDPDTKEVRFEIDDVIYNPNIKIRD